MNSWIALFRGINVGGRNILPMAALKAELESLQLKNVRTYIQSGNVVFEAAIPNTAALTEKITRRIEEVHGFRPELLLLRDADLRAAIHANPFPDAVADPKTLHLLFLAEPATNPDGRALDGLKAASEEFVLTERVFYLHAPDGIGRSKLAARAEKLLGVVATARNYRTVDKLLSMVSKG